MIAVDCSFAVKRNVTGVQRYAAELLREFERLGCDFLRLEPGRVTRLTGLRQLREQLLLPRMPFVAVNPEIVATSDSTAEHDEGCLSLPDLYAPVVRPEKVVFRTATLDGEMIECECGGLLGRCIQHELDHLDGKLFIDRVAPEELRKVDRQLKQLIRHGEQHHYQRVTSR